MVVALLVFLDQIVEHSKSVFPIQLASQTNYRPASEEAEHHVSEPGEGQHERHRLAREPVAENAERIERGNKAHQTAQRESDQPQADPISVSAKKLREGCQKPRGQRQYHSSKEDQQRQFETNDSHVL